MEVGKKVLKGWLPSSGPRFKHPAVLIHPRINQFTLDTRSHTCPEGCKNEVTFLTIM